MGASADNATHANRGGAFKQRSSNNSIGPRYGITATSNGQHTVVYTLYDLAHARLDTGFVAKVGDILAALSNNDACFLGGYNGAERQWSLGVLFVRLGCW